MGPGGDPAILIQIWQEAFPSSQGGGDVFLLMMALVAVGVIVLCCAAARLPKQAQAVDMADLNRPLSEIHNYKQHITKSLEVTDLDEIQERTKQF